LDSVANENNRFAFNLFQKIYKENSNTVFSPYSISTAFAMLYEGARNETDASIKSVMHFALDKSTFHQTMNRIDLDITNSSNNDSSVFKSTNRIWCQEGYQFNGPFIDVLSQYYGVGINELDFLNNPDPSRITINDWIAEQTNDKIKDLLSEGTITTSTEVVLTNTVYFNAKWKSPFDLNGTYDNDFTTANGSVVSVPTMTSDGSRGIPVSYAVSNSFSVLELPYDNNGIVMTIIMPDVQDFSSFASSFTNENYATAISALDSVTAIVKMPKFKIAPDGIMLKQTLEDLGITNVFDNADFSGINDRDLFVSSVIHKAFIDVTETGTEAAASTAIVIDATLIPTDPPMTIAIDKSFMFFLRHAETGTILFMGTMCDPSK